MAYHHASPIDPYLCTKFHRDRTEKFSKVISQFSSKFKSHEKQKLGDIKNPAGTNLDIVL